MTDNTMQYGGKHELEWWHAYGAKITEGDLTGCLHLVVVSATGLTPKQIQERMPDYNGMPYIASWDHQPSEDEKDEVEL